MTLLLVIVAGLLLVSLATPMLRRVWTFHLLVSKYLLLWLGDVIRLRKFVLGLRGRRWTKMTRPRMARLFCEDMGVTFVKLGQVVASSSGLFPEAYVDEFQKVLDRVRPFSFDEVRETLAEELGEANLERFRNIDARPLASASVAQVHAAELADGTEVVAKVQRPGIGAQICADMKILAILAAIAQRFSTDLKLANVVGIVEDLKATLTEELDFRKEANNLEQFNQIMREHGHTRVHAPVPHWEYVTERVLIMERFYGTRVDDVAGIKSRGVDAEESLVEGMLAWFQCLIFHGFFHGDVHAGNLMLLDNEDIGFLDFGIVGRFSDRQRYLVTDYIVAFATSDFKKLASVILEMGGVDEGVDLESFSEDLAETYKPILSMSFANLNYAEVVPKINRVARKHKMSMPKEFVLITKQLLYFDRYAKLLAPSLNLFTDPRLVMSMVADIQKQRQERDDPQ